MPVSSSIEVIEIGIPGPPGQGVSAPEKASFVTLSGANVFTGANEIRVGSTTGLIVSGGSLTTDRSLVADTTNKEIELWNGADLRGFSDAGTTETYSIDGATGNIQTDGILTVDGGQIKGEQLWHSFMIDGGGSAITTGSKIFWKIPYNCQIITDGSKAWDMYFKPGETASMGLDLWMSASYPPTSANRISGTLGSQNPRIVSANSASSATLTGWTINLVKGYYLILDANSVTGSPTWVTLALHVKKT